MISPPTETQKSGVRDSHAPSTNRLLLRTFRAFAYPDFRLMWFGACTSSIGTWMQKLAQSWLVLELSNSPFLLGVDAFLGEFPIILFSLAGGVAADRIDRRRVLLASQFVQMSSAFLLMTLVLTGQIRVWHILCLSFTVGVAQAFGGPAYQALLPSLVNLKDISNAIALNSIQFNLARVIGPVLGGLALTQFGAAWCFGLNGLSFIAVIASLLLIRTGFIPIRTPESFSASLKNGLHFIRNRPAMPGLMALAFAVTMLGSPVTVFLPVFARDIFSGGPTTYSLFLSVFGAGSITGALAVASMSHAQKKGRIVLTTLLALGTTVTAFSRSSFLPISAVFLFLTGAALVGVFSLLSSVVQEITPDEMRGRVMSVYNVAFRGGMPVGSLVIGTMIPHFSAPAVLAVNGILIAALGAYYLAAQRRVSSL